MENVFHKENHHSLLISLYQKTILVEIDFSECLEIFPSAKHFFVQPSVVIHISISNRIQKTILLLRALIDFSECLEIFPSANSTERRQFVVHKLSHFNCDCPNINFTSATAFRTHMTSVHSDKKNLSLRY
jgi:hypothetical protein